MCKTASHKAEEEKLIQEISELEEKLAFLEANIPAHSMSVLLMQKIEEVNDGRDEVERIAEHLSFISPDISYISIPTRPPAEKLAKPAEESKVGLAYQVFNKRGLKAEYLIGYEGNAFASTGDVEKDLLSITSVHPMREEAVNELLEKNNANWDIVRKLVNKGKLVELEFDGKSFYVREFPDVERR